MAYNTSNDFISVEDLLGVKCIWRTETPLRPRCVLMTADEQTPVMEFSRKWSWTTVPAQFAWRDFQGTLKYQQTSKRRFPYSVIFHLLLEWPLPFDWCEVLLDSDANITAVKSPGVNAHESEIATPNGVYDMGLHVSGRFPRSKKTLRVSDADGDIIVSDWYSQDIRVVRLIEDSPILLALAWRRTEGRQG